MKNKRILLMIVLLSLIGIIAYMAYNFVITPQYKTDETPLPMKANREISKDVEKITQTIYRYDSENLRDPFLPLIVKRQVGQKTISPLESYDIEELKLTGIVFDRKGSFALIQTPDGKFHVAKEKEKIGISGGIITKIGKDFIEIKESQAHGGFAPKTKQLKLRLEE